MKRITTMRSELPKFKGDLFTPMAADSKLDKLFSARGGLMPGVNMIVVGDPGVGKTTLLLDYAADLSRKGKKVLFVSAEMNAIDMVDYCNRYPKFLDMSILFLGDYVEQNAQKVLKEELNEGYDVVVMDSWAEVVDLLKDSHKGYISKTTVDSDLLKILDIHNKGNNRVNKNTAFLIVQQVTKAGGFAGSNRLKHMTTGMFHIRFDKGSGGRYIHFSKNRRGGDGNLLFFSLAKAGGVEYLHAVSPNDIED